MDAEVTAGYREACAQCSAVDWGLSDEGGFYCRTCHSVAERGGGPDVGGASFTPGSSRISTVGRGRKSRTNGPGRAWLLCEGFQFILKVQADALLTLRGQPGLQDRVLWDMWRLYLQKSGRAYTQRAARSPAFRLDQRDPDPPTPPQDSDSSRTAVIDSEGDTSADPRCVFPQRVCIVSDSTHLCGGRGQRALSMSTTLALLHLALVWSREALTLSDLLRLVDQGHLPYVHAYERLPDEMKVEGKAAVVFRVESVPSHGAVHREAESLLSLLQLPAFPPISSQSLLHPARLSLRYLLDANLPAQLHPLLCRLMERRGMMDARLHTAAAASPAALPRYDAQAAALIVVAMKLLYGLDDQSEWSAPDLTGTGGDRGTEDRGTEDQFSLRRWFRLLHQVLVRAENQRKVDDSRLLFFSRKQWKTSSKPLCLNRRNRCVVMKKKRVAQQLRSCLHKLSAPPAAAQQLRPSSFRFCWGDRGGADGPSFHQKKLPGVLSHPLRGSWYWHPALKPCHPRMCRGHYAQAEATLPHSFKWFLRLFGFLLDIRPPRLYEEVLKVERRLFSGLDG
uniref:TATA box-binding protein-associated factor RNA polymerase I subunit B n=1 Tax=Tetraodon nigroviridis TaxID=99883 RepID=H3C9Y5_TETNG